MPQPTVMLVEDDADMRRSLEFVLRTRGYEVAAFDSPRAFLAAYDPDIPGCLVLDFQLPEIDGLALQQQLAAAGFCHPFLVITGHGTVASAVAAMREGAVDFLEKPFDHERFLDCVARAVQEDATQRAQRDSWKDLKQRLDNLTPREREVLDLVVAGRLTKQIAAELGISTKTVEVHRSHVTRKLGTKSVAQLVQLVTEYQLRTGKR